MFQTVVMLVLGISMTEAIAQSVAYRSVVQKSNLLFLVAWFMYIFVVYLLCQVYKYKGIGYVNVLWSGFTTMLMLTIGYVFFGERLTKIEWIGVGFVFLGIMILGFRHLPIGNK